MPRAPGGCGGGRAAPAGDLLLCSGPQGGGAAACGCRVRHRPGAGAQGGAARRRALLKELTASLDWESRKIFVHGRECSQPRLVCYMADGPELGFRYSGLTMEVRPWAPAVRALKRDAEQAANLPPGYFNSCLLNLYRDGDDYMGWHSDDEKLYGDRPVIASVSLGAARDFMVRPRGGRDGPQWKYTLEDGDLLVMDGDMQRHFQHSVPKRKRAAGRRINLTFRRIVHPDPRLAPQGMAPPQGRGALPKMEKRAGSTDKG